MVKGKKIKPCLATILAIKHGVHDGDSAPVKAALERFKQFIKPGKTLYIELTKEDIEDFRMNPETTKLSGYELIIDNAIKSGMQVEFLDTAKLSEVYDNLIRAAFRWGDVSENAKRFGFDRLEYQNVTRRFAQQVLRERKWALRLRNAKEGDIAVMYPAHAYRIAPALGVSHNKVIWLHWPDPKIVQRIGRLTTPEKIARLRALRDTLRKDRQKKIRNKKKTPISKLPR